MDIQYSKKPTLIIFTRVTFYKSEPIFAKCAKHCNTRINAKLINNYGILSDYKKINYQIKKVKFINE